MPKRLKDSFATQLSAYMAKLGRKGGKASGARRMNMPAEVRRSVAQKGAAALWKKRRQKARQPKKAVGM